MNGIRQETYEIPVKEFDLLRRCDNLEFYKIVCISDDRLSSIVFQTTMVCQESPTTLTLLNIYKKE